MMQDEDRREWRMIGDIYYDGSCIQFMHDPDMAWAAWAVVQLAPAPSLGSEAVCFWPVSSEFEQSSQVGEQIGCAMAHHVACWPYRLVGDCRDVVDDHQRPARVVLDAKRANAGWVRVGRNHMAKKVPKSAVLQHDWRRAHTIDEVIRDARVPVEQWLPELRQLVADSGERRRAVGNRFADFYAQEAVGLHPQQRAHFWRDAKHEFQLREKILRTIGAVLALWLTYEKELDAPEVDSGSEGEGEEVNAPVAELPPPPETPHAVRLMGMRWTCMCCLKHVRTEAMARKLEEREECRRSFGPTFRAIMRERKGHMLVCTGTPEGHPVLVCIRCAGWAMTATQLLAETCRGKFVCKDRTRALERMREGLRPSDHGRFCEMRLDGVAVEVDAVIRRAPSIVGDEVDLLAEPALAPRKKKRGGRPPRRKLVLPASAAAGAPGDGAVGDDEAAPETPQRLPGRLRTERTQRHGEREASARGRVLDLVAAARGP